MNMEHSTVVVSSLSTEITHVIKAFLKKCPDLWVLNLKDCPLSDVSFLAECKSLQWLNLSGSQVSGVSALATCTDLKSLNLKGCRVSDVPPWLNAHIFGGLNCRVAA